MRTQTGVRSGMRALALAAAFCAGLFGAEASPARAAGNSVDITYSVPNAIGVGSITYHVLGTSYASEPSFVASGTT